MKGFSPARQMCVEVRALSDAYIDHELRAESRLPLLRHIGACQECRSVIRTKWRLKRRVSEAVRAVEAPPRLSQSIQRWIRLGTG